MKRIIIYTISLLVAFSVSASSVSASSVSTTKWEVGTEADIEGNYDKAIEEYHAILDGGEYSMKLYYNLANAYFKLGAIGKSILYYNKALRIAPSQEDICHNLAIAEAQTKDRIAVIPEFFLNRWLRTMRNAMSCTAWSVLSLIWFGMLLAFALLFLLASRIRWRKVGFYGVVGALMLFVVCTSFAISSRHDMLLHDEAIVMSTAISVKSSPDNSATDLFVLHEGTKVKVLSEVDEWCEVVIADGKKGWTLKSNIEEI